MTTWVSDKPVKDKIASSSDQDHRLVKFAVEQIELAKKETSDYSGLLNEFMQSEVKVQKVEMKKEQMKEEAENEKDVSVL